MFNESIGTQSLTMYNEDEISGKNFLEEIPISGNT